MSGFKGTTIVAFFFKRNNGRNIERGIMLGVDSRLSNKKQIIDTGKKVLDINDNILIIMAGSGQDCETMCEDVKRQLSNRVEPLKVEDVLNMVVDHLNANLGDDMNNTNIGTLVAGWDKEKDLQVYRTKLKYQWVTWTGEHTYVSVGSGSKFALDILKPRYEFDKFNMSIDNAADLALRALFDATYNDKSTGGTLYVYHVDETKCHEKYSLDALDVYSKYYNDKDFSDRKQRTLFLLCLEHVYADSLKAYFRPHGNTKAAHCVAKRGDFYFHRLVFDSPDVASIVYDYVKGTQYTPPPLKFFPYGVFLESGVPVYVQRSSEELLKHICDMEDKHDEKCIDDLEVYLKYYEHYYSVHEYDQRTFFFVSSERLLAKDLKSIKALFSPRGEGIEARWVAKRGDFHFHRFFFRSESEASSACLYIKGINNAPPPLKDLPFRMGLYLKPEVPVYVEKSSKELLERICKLAPESRHPQYSHLLENSSV